GEIVDDYVYGRGALDDKASAFGILEALETLLSHDWNPSYNFYFCFGQDEEIGGRNGAGVAAAMCREKDITFRTIFDEAGTISVGSVPGLENTPVALIGVAEKGYISVEVNFEQPGGHSSMPDTENAILSASAFITSLNEDPIFKPEFTEPLQGFMTHLAPEMSFGLKWAFGLRPLTNSLILSNYQGSSTGRALTTNTAVATMVGAGIKDNVVPSSSRVVCNTRILPGYSVDDIVNAYSQRAAEYGGTVQWYNDYGAGPTATSSFDGEDFLTLGQSIRATFPEALVSPYLTLGGTDSKNFDGLAKQTYRFLPIALTPEDLPRIHGINERLHVDAYRDLCRFYLDLFQRI
ncbi:MAG: M20/M25/M40 family metallo-hydrolase, partial [Cryomorphaceae bacterium]|nr:M20/M25/M40 family metallo-hydrolase [Cryomorphaceae bacterium]